MGAIVGIAVALLVIWLLSKVLSAALRDTVTLVMLLKDPDSRNWIISTLVGGFIVYKVVDILTGWDYHSVNAYVVIPAMAFAVVGVYFILDLAEEQIRKRIEKR